MIRENLTIANYHSRTTMWNSTVAVPQTTLATSTTRANGRHAVSMDRQYYARLCRDGDDCRHLIVFTAYIIESDRPNLRGRNSEMRNWSSVSVRNRYKTTKNITMHIAWTLEFRLIRVTIISRNRQFPVAVARTWYSLASVVTTPLSMCVFKQWLQTFLSTLSLP